MGLGLCLCVCSGLSASLGPESGAPCHGTCHTWNAITHLQLIRLILGAVLAEWLSTRQRWIVARLPVSFPASHLKGESAAIVDFLKPAYVFSPGGLWR